MAQVKIDSVPREFEVTRQFEAEEADEAALKSLRDKLFSSDVDNDMKTVLGRSIEQLRMIDFIRVLWGRFGQFVQRVPMLQDTPGGLRTAAPARTLLKSEVTTRYGTSGDVTG